MQTSKSYTHAHTRAHTHIQRPHSYPTRLMYVTIRNNHTCLYTCSYVHAKLT